MLTLILIQDYMGNRYEQYIKFDKVRDHKFSKELLVWI